MTKRTVLILIAICIISIASGFGYIMHKQAQTAAILKQQEETRQQILKNEKEDLRKWKKENEDFEKRGGFGGI